MFAKKSQNNFQDVAAGIALKTIAYGDKTLMCEFKLKKGHLLPMHSHPHEQTGLVIAGKIILQIGKDKYEAEPGDSWCIAGNIEHGAEIIEDTTVIEVFSPVREDYLELGEK